MAFRKAIDVKIQQKSGQHFVVDLSKIDHDHYNDFIVQWVIIHVGMGGTS